MSMTYKGIFVKRLPSEYQTEAENIINQAKPNLNNKGDYYEYCCRAGFI